MSWHLTLGRYNDSFKIPRMVKPEKQTELFENQSKLESFSYDSNRTFYSNRSELVNKNDNSLYPFIFLYLEHYILQSWTDL